MGMTAILAINCDQLDELEHMADLGRRIGWVVNGANPSLVGLSALQRVTVHHADGELLLNTKHYRAFRLDDDANPVSLEARARLLKEYARSLGYNLVKLPGKHGEALRQAKAEVWDARKNS